MQYRGDEALVHILCVVVYIPNNNVGKVREFEFAFLRGIARRLLDQYEMLAAMLCAVHFEGWLEAL